MLLIATGLLHSFTPPTALSRRCYSASLRGYLNWDLCCRPKIICRLPPKIVGIRFCVSVYRSDPSSLHLLLYFEPLSIAFETLQAILVHGFQFLDIWLPHSACNSSDCQMPKLFNTLTAEGNATRFGHTICSPRWFSSILAASYFTLKASSFNIYWERKKKKNYYLKEVVSKVGLLVVCAPTPSEKLEL
ncbi:uncharacterized protein LOC107625626 isoform X1 [Arachis ipaensis]|uniref:uncharacterized protein LOC107625626 isoform X1 n=1 Tax=Arachis ipaensis TaxID=130454 RepID=UPI000A2B337D|nr:uncharacterized protein LOC107625626 isoform X1 [Arachis ipaensis]XP_025633530.1 uncharacterized protein LOC112727829 isoform X3 [Arachis hypogaea]